MAPNAEGSAAPSAAADEMQRAAGGVNREQVPAYRYRIQGLAAMPGTVSAGDIAILDFGVQDTGPDGARWALVQRGADPGIPLIAPDLALAWSLRGAPHLYRRSDMPALAAAVYRYSATDAGKRIYAAAKPLKAAGLDLLEALDAVAAAERDIVRAPMGKGELSGRLAALLPGPYLRYCRPCAATHPYEMPFRLAALQAGLELRPGISLPELLPIRGWPWDGPGPARRHVPERLDPIRNYLHFYGPATPRQAAAFLDAALAEVKPRWPADAVPVEVVLADAAAEDRWMLATDGEALAASAPAPPRAPGTGWPLILPGGSVRCAPARARDWGTAGRSGPRTSGNRLRPSVCSGRLIPICRARTATCWYLSRHGRRRCGRRSAGQALSWMGTRLRAAGGPGWPTGSLPSRFRHLARSARRCAPASSGRRNCWHSSAGCQSQP